MSSKSRFVLRHAIAMISTLIAYVGFYVWAWLSLGTNDGSIAALGLMLAFPVYFPIAIVIVVVIGGVQK